MALLLTLEVGIFLQVKHCPEWIVPKACRFFFVLQRALLGCTVYRVPCWNQEAAWTDCLSISGPPASCSCSSFSEIYLQAASLVNLSSTPGSTSVPQHVTVLLLYYTLSTGKANLYCTDDFWNFHGVHQ